MVSEQQKLERERELLDLSCQAFADMVSIQSWEMAQDQANGAFESYQELRYLEYLQDA